MVKKRGDELEKYRAPALEKGLDILETLAGADGGMTTSQIAASLGRTPNELFRMIQVLERKGYIGPGESGEGFELTNRLFALGMARAQMRDLTEAALPVMRRLAREIRQSCHVAVPSGAQIVVVARVEDPGYFGYSVRAGHRRQILESTSGAVLFAFQPAEVQAEWGERIFRDMSDEVRQAFVTNAQRIRERGLGMRNSDLIPTVIDLSAPVLANDTAVAALTVPYIPKANALSIDDTAERVVGAAREISDALH